MKRKRLTQVFPFLLPIRKWQRKNAVGTEDEQHPQRCYGNRFE